ncbi:MAG: galactose-1-phosphate uridylyltransferase [Methanoregulaceae archaeon]|nr:galactose-1-phosphate uridylyltransferase [Methanoregulaceae archaeon]
MFTISEIAVGTGILQYREERYTGLRCKISPERLKRHIDQSLLPHADSSGCPFCPENVLTVTPTFSDNRRVTRGESVTFPNLFPFAEWHTVTVITRQHMVLEFSLRQISDALFAQIETLQRFDGYPSINWNFLPSAGASLVHPHLQGLSDRRPSTLAERYIRASDQYRNNNKETYWDAVRKQERDSERYLFGDEIFWYAQGVPLGEKEIRGILPVSSIAELGNFVDRLAKDLLTVISLYQKLGTYSFNMSIFFDKMGEDHGFSAFCTFISRINPNPQSTSDSAFMERLHLEPVILTLPEDIGKYFRKE